MTDVFNRTVYMSTNMFIKRKIDGALKGKATCISTVYMASAKPVKKNFQKSPLKDEKKNHVYLNMISK